MSKDLNNQEKLEAIYEMTIENNEILRTIRRQQYFANALRVLYWLMVVGAIGGAYFFVKPIVSSFTENSGKIEETYTQLRGQLPETRLLNQIMEALKPKEVPVDPEANTDAQMVDDGVINSTTTAKASSTTN